MGMIIISEKLGNGQTTRVSWDYGWTINDTIYFLYTFGSFVSFLFAISYLIIYIYMYYFFIIIRKIYFLKY